MSITMFQALMKRLRHGGSKWLGPESMNVRIRRYSGVSLGQLCHFIQRWKQGRMTG